MPSQFAKVRVGFADHLPYMTEAQLKVFLALLLRSDLQGHLSVTVSELARSTGLGRPAVRSALDWLAAPTTPDDTVIDPYIKRTKDKITIPKFVSGEATDKKFTIQAEEDPDQRIRDLELTISRLHRQIAQTGIESGLAEQLPHGASEVARECEFILGRPLNGKEIYYLGQMVGFYGEKGVIAEVKKKKNANDPLRAAYGALNGYTKGKVINKRKVDIPSDKSNYWEPSGTSVWD